MRKFFYCVLIAIVFGCEVIPNVIQNLAKRRVQSVENRSEQRGLVFAFNTISFVPIDFQQLSIPPLGQILNHVRYKEPCQNYKISKKQKYANEIQHKVANQLKRDFDLIPFGSGAQMMDQIEMLHLAFQYAKPANIDCARSLAVAAVEEFIVAVNADEHIRPYLANYPFESKNIEVTICFLEPNRKPVAEGKLCMVDALGGFVIYKIDESATNRFKTIHRESFDEAVGLVAQRVSIK